MAGVDLVVDFVKERDYIATFNMKLCGSIKSNFSASPVIYISS